VSCNSRLAIRARMGHICGMAGTVGKRGGYSYAQVESALGTLFRVPASALGSFRGRVRHLQRIGLVDVAPGKGRRILYTRIQTTEWMLALLLAEFGVDPIVIVKSVQRERNKLHEWIREATDEEALGGNDVFLATRPALMSGGWAFKHSAGILRFQKFRRRDSALKIARHDWHASPSRRPGQKATVPPIGLIATSSPGEANPTGPIHSLNAEDLTAGRPVLGIPELRVLDFADPLLLVVNLTRPVRALGTALESTLSD
jgi:hypothetical protein